MNIPWEQLAVMSGMGALGGLLQCIMRDKFQLPHRDTNDCHFGSIGTIFLGAMAAPVVWALYGPWASLDTAGTTQQYIIHIPLLQLASSVLVGISGGEVLKLETQKQILGGEKEDLNRTKNILVKYVKTAMKDLEEK